MSGTKEIRTKIKSVQNTRKITKAMEMVAASKMRKAQEKMMSTRPYGEKVRNVIAHLLPKTKVYVGVSILMSLEQPGLIIKNLSLMVRRLMYAVLVLKG